MSIQLWLTFILLNFLNGLTFYYVIYNVVTPRTVFLFNEITSNKPRITLKLLLIFIAYGLGIGTIFYWIGDIAAAAMIAHISSVPVFILVIKYVANEKLLSAALAFALSNLIVLFFQSPLLTFLLIFDLSLTPYFALMMEILSFVSIIFLCKHFLLHDIFLFIKMSVSLVNLIFVFTLTILIFFLGIRWETVQYFTWFFSLMTFAGVVAFYMMAMHTMKLREEAHDTGNLLEGLEFLLKTEENLEKAETHYTKTLKKIGFDIPEKKSFEVGKYEDNLLALIERKKQKRKSKAKIVTNIKFHGSHEKVPIPIMIQMLGTLLDNTFETKTIKPIFINITVTGTNLEITTINESDRKTSTEIDLMFGRKYSTKKGDRGYGLPKLLKLVKSYGGDIEAHCNYRKEYNSHYLTITVKIEDQ